MGMEMPAGLIAVNVTMVRTAFLPRLSSLEACIEDVQAELASDDLARSAGKGARALGKVSASLASLVRSSTDLVRRTSSMLVDAVERYEAADRAMASLFGRGGRHE